MSTRTKGILIALITVAGIAAAGYLAAPRLVAAIAVHSLEGVVEVRQLDIDSVGLSRIEVAALRADTPQMSFEARRLTIHFDPWAFQFRDVTVREARVEITGAAADAEPGAAAGPVLPPFPIRVDELSLRAATPWGEVAFPVSVETRPGAAGGLEGLIEGPDFSLALSNPDDNRHELALFDAAESDLVSLTVRNGMGFPMELDGRLAPDALSRWLAGSDIAPPALRSVLEPYALTGTAVNVSGVLQQTLDFVAELSGDLNIHDTRDPPDRSFEAIELEMGPAYTVSRAGASWAGSGETGFSFALDSETRLSGRNPGWRWNEDGLSFNAASVRLDPQALRADAIELNTPSFGFERTAGDFRAGAVRLEGWPDGLAHYAVSGDWIWDGASLDARGRGDGPGAPNLAWELQAGGPRGHVEINVQDTVASIERFLASHATLIAPDLEILAGQLEARYYAAWAPGDQQTTLQIQAGPVDADLGGMEIRGLDVRVDNRENRIDRLVAVISSPSLKLAAGTVAEDLKMNLRLSPPRIQVDAAQIGLFDGHISVRPFSFEPDDEEVVVFADVDALSLGKVMALMDLEATRLTGHVAGPVRIVYHADRGIEINKGDLRSVQAGVLSLQMNPDASMAAQFNNIALRALEDFRYDELSASLVYQPDGEYRITARILGRNPKVLDGHPIALNPTIEGRLPALFRAFFFTGDFNQAIIQRLQEERGVSTPGQTPTLSED